ncbi:hypothetical protein [Salinicola halophilus]|uniref:hypothetical protein n=1 Tax=Salinicola halophilus TaxID=184065 RepID=UPI000DA135D3|nr:hypothetical protein [Salinicola halophilus]
MSVSDPLEFHLDRTDLRGLALLVFVIGLGLVYIALSVTYRRVPAEGWWGCGIVATVVLLGAVGVFWQRARRGRGLAEHITVDADGFHSRLHGRIPFEAITGYRKARDIAPLRWEHNAPSLVLTLTDGRQLRYHLDRRHYAEDILDYVGFVDAAVLAANGQAALVQREPPLGRQRLFDASPASAAETTPSLVGTDTDTQTRASGERRSSSASTAAGANRSRSDARASSSAQTDDAATRLGAANGAAVQRSTAQKAHQRKILSYVVLGLLALLVIVRLFGSEIRSVVNPSPFDGMKEKAPAAFELSKHRLARAIAAKGPVFLWGRPAPVAVQPVLLPNVTVHSGIGMPALDLMSAAGRISDFLLGGEAEGYRVALRYGEALARTPRTRVSQASVEGEGALYFYLIASDALESGASARPMRTRSWRVNYRDIETLPERIEESLQARPTLSLAMAEQWLTMTPSPYLFVTASAYHGMTEAQFDAVTQALAKYFAARGVDTASFATQRFDSGVIGPEKESDHDR